MRRHDQRDGCGARGLRRNEALGRRRGSARVHYEIPPGAGFKSPILTRSGMKRGPPPANTASKHALGMRRAELGAQAARSAVAHQIRAHVARREAPAAFRKEERTPQVCAFRRAIPLMRMGDFQQSPDASRIAAMLTHGSLTSRSGARDAAIIKKVRGVNRVVYDIALKPPGTIEGE